MAKTNKVTVELGNPQEKKYVTRYDFEDQDDAEAAMSSAYINKSALKAIGNPARVKITIEAA